MKRILIKILKTAFTSIIFNGGLHGFSVVLHLTRHNVQFVKSLVSTKPIHCLVHIHANRINFDGWQTFMEVQPLLHFDFQIAASQT